MAVDRAQQRVDVDKRPLLDPGQHRCPLSQRDQVPAQDRGQLPGVAEGELAQKNPERGGGVDTGEQVSHSTRADDVEVLEAVRAGRHPSDDRGQLRCRVRRPRGDPLINEPHMLIQQLRKPGLFTQFQQRDQTRMRHEIVLVKHCAIRAPGMRSLHRECPWSWDDRVCLGPDQTGS